MTKGLVQCPSQKTVITNGMWNYKENLLGLTQNLQNYLKSTLEAK